MKKIIKFSIIVLSIITISYMSFTKIEANAKTLGDLIDELNETEEKYKNNQNQKTLTESQIRSINNSITNIQGNITKTYKDIENLEIEIQELNNQIDEKEEQIKDIINFEQLSNGESVYLEYMFGAKDFTDFIYRSAITEQLAKYNEKLIDDYNKNIEDNKKKQEEIESKRENLKVQQENLEEQLDKLGSQLKEITDISVDIKDQIKSLREMVEIYRERGCKVDQNISTCGKSVLPSNTKFYRPLVKGFGTSEWSTYRTGTFSGFHSGLDMSVSPNSNVKVYAAGTGMVASIVYKTSCGGTYVIVHHKMTNGSTYTTMYMHLASVKVRKGDTVTKDTVIGIMGGGHNKKVSSNYTPWDSCTTGAHLHFTIATGLYGVDYTKWNSFMSHTFDPRSIVNFPSGLYNWWSDRITAY